MPHCAAPAPSEGTDVNQETTTQELRIRFLHSWFVSFVLHGLLLFSFLPLFRQSMMTLPKEPFHWDVTLIQSTEAPDEPVQPAGATEPIVSSQPERPSLPAHAHRSNNHARSYTERITPLAPHTEALIAPEFQPSMSSSDASQTEPAPASTSDESMPNLLPASAPSLQQPSPPISPTTQEPPVSETVAAAAGEGSTPATEAVQPSSPLPTTSDTDSASVPRPDYGWLQQAIFKRLEELKRSSRPVLDESRPLKVTVKAVVSREGALLDSAIAKSSGLDRIDQEAMALVQRAFPMPLDRTLDRGQIVMRIPITYSRE